MPETVTSYILDNDVAFERGLKRLAELTDDFRIPFTEITKHFEQGNKIIFSLKSAGLYPDLSTKPFRAFWENKRKYGALYKGGYKEYKKENTGFVYPILVGETGDLGRSLMSRTAKGAVRIVRKQELFMGTNIEYAKYHQSDMPRKRLPQRKIVFISGGGEEVARDSYISGRREAWLNILNNHALQLLEKQGYQVYV